MVEALDLPSGMGPSTALDQSAAPGHPGGEPPLEIDHLETPSPLNPVGLKGVGAHLRCCGRHSNVTERTVAAPPGDA